MNIMSFIIKITDTDVIIIIQRRKKMPKLSEEGKKLRKQIVLSAAMEVFQRKGYERATLKDIIEQTGMSRGWIYLYYTDKKQIFMDLLSYMDQQQEQQLEDLKNRSHHVLDLLKTYFQSIKGVFSSSEPNIYPAIYEFWITSWRDEEVKAFFLKRYQHVKLLFTNLLLQSAKDGQISPKVPVEDIVKMMMSTMDGIMVHTLAFGMENIDMEAQLQQLLSRLENMLNSQ
jgi:AcrR family transcriptional regulator